jgi:hypothetical protein
LSPQSPPVFLRLSLISPELLHILKWKSCISKSIPLLDDFCIQEGPIQKIDISQEATISIPLLPLKLKACLLPINHLFGEKICFSSKILDRFLRMFGFRSIHTDQTDSFPIDKKKSVSIDDTFYFINLGMGSGEKKKKD